MISHNEQQAGNTDETKVYPVYGYHLIDAEPGHGNPDQAYCYKSYQHHQDEVEEQVKNRLQGFRYRKQCGELVRDKERHDK